MAVDAKGCGDVRVTQYFLNHSGGNTLDEEERRAAVTEIVEPLFAKSRIRNGA